MYNCKQCDFALPTINAYINHCRLHSMEPRFRVACCVSGCFQSFSTFWNLKKHIYRNHGQNKFNARLTSLNNKVISLSCQVPMCGIIHQFNAQYDKHIGWLQDHHNLPSSLWNVYEIERLHSLTYPLQRADIVELNALKIVSLVAKWPFLFKANRFLHHFKTLTGVDIAFIFEENLKIKSTIIVKFLQHQKEMQLAINEMILAGQGNVLAPLVAAILGICQFLKESSEFLFHQTMEHANVDDIEKDITLPFSPCISFAGNISFLLLIVY
nr:uncharacterized protein LOC105850076 [Hydra vulgaris]